MLLVSEGCTVVSCSHAMHGICLSLYKLGSVFICSRMLHLVPVSCSQRDKNTLHGKAIRIETEEEGMTF